MRLPTARLLTFVLVSIVVTTANADVRLPRLLGDGAILQRDTPVDAWGWADDGERVQVYLDGVRVGMANAKDGKWRVSMGAHAAGGPHKIVVVGSNIVTIDDVWFGDVWLASGQSNMELPMSRVRTRFPEEIANADNAMIREFAVPKKADFNEPQIDFESGEWQAAAPATVQSFSAVGYFFAKSLNARYDVPIGIIKSAYGGSAAESWMSEEALEEWPHYLEVATSYRDEDYLEGLRTADRENSAAWFSTLESGDAGLSADPVWSEPQVDDSDWDEVEVPGFWSEPAGAGVTWYRKSVELPAEAEDKAATLNLGRIIDSDTAWVNGIEVGSTGYEWPPRIYDVPAGVLTKGSNTIAVRVVSNARRGGFFPDKPYSLVFGEVVLPLDGAWRARVGTSVEPHPPSKFVEWTQPLGFYNAMLAPLSNVQFKGVIWYQGETNVGRAEEYAELFPAMIEDWRSLFRQRELPFLFVQLANYLEASEEPVESDWAELRAAQQQALRVPDTAMVVAIDVGEWNDIHPLDKKTIGERLALAAREVAYDEAEVVSSGPLATSVERDENGLRVLFDHIAGGLVTDGNDLDGFAIAGEDRNYRRASAEIDGDTVVVRNESIEAPVAVRYAWADNPDRANLYNAEGLPAAPFELSLPSTTTKLVEK